MVISPLAEMGYISDKVNVSFIDWVFGEILVYIEEFYEL